MKIRKPTPAGTVLAGVVLVLSLALIPAAFAGKGAGGAGKGGGGGGSTISRVMVVDNNSDGLPNYGDTVTFKVSTSASYPSVQLTCYQNGALVFAQSAGFFPTYVWSKNFTLKGDRWPGGAADCTAVLYYTTRNGTTTTLASLSFTVSP